MFSLKKTNTMSKNIFSFFLLLCLVIGVCDLQAQKYHEQNNEMNSNTNNKRNGGIPPDNCKMIGEVVKVSTERTSNGVCAENPCVATIKVVEILGYGSGFSTPLNIGQEITINFAFTLSPTNNLFPELNEPLEGLEEGDKFEALVIGSERMGEGKSYKIYAYKKK